MNRRLLVLSQKLGREINTRRVCLITHCRRIRVNRSQRTRFDRLPASPVPGPFSWQPQPRSTRQSEWMHNLCRFASSAKFDE